MQTTNKISFLLPAAAFVIAVSGCAKKLEEHPFVGILNQPVVYYTTAPGFQTGINALYSGMRWDYGPEGTCGITCDGTDEWTYADQPRTGAGGTADFLTMGNYTLDASNGSILTPWNRNYSNINLANLLVTVAPQVAISDAARNVSVGEARFLRGLYYLLLVDQFGAVPVDLGSGELKFNQLPYQGFNRLPADQVLAKDYQTMIDDFTFASQNLPDQRPAGTFKLSKAAAFGMLAKAYLFRGYTSAKQGTDFANALAAATEVINNQGKYGVALQQDFSRVHAPGNDYNSEILYAVERIPGDLNDNETLAGQIGAGKEIDAANDFNPDYTSVKSPLASSATTPCGTRSTLYGRPIRRFCPTAWLFNTAFADKVNDSRFDGSFRMVWLATQAGGGFNVGDTAFILANTNAIADSLNGVLPGGPRLKPYRVVAPREFYVVGGTFAQNIYPQLKKYDDPAKAAANDPGGRPFPVIKLSELYLMAAEAAMLGTNTTAAAGYINTLRTRAAYRTGLSTTEINNRVAALQVASGQVNIDFILDERTRELAGESLRWPDLAIRGKLLDRVKANNLDAAPKIDAHHLLRPIPQSQLNAVASTNPAQYQNPGY